MDDSLHTSQKRNYSGRDEVAPTLKEVRQRMLIVERGRGGLRLCDVRQLYEERLKPEALGTEPFFSCSSADFTGGPKAVMDR